MNLPAFNQSGHEYVIFDKKNGRILQRHSSFDAAQNTRVAIPLDKLRTQFSHDDSVVSRVTDRDPQNLDFLEIKPGPRARGALLVDPEKRQLVARPVLSLKADKNELTGNGSDKAVIEIQVADENGKPVRTHDGKVKVTTSRGKLSAPGGVVQLERGHAKIALTSVNETVSRVTVEAKALDDSCGLGRITLEFL